MVREYNRTDVTPDGDWLANNRQLLNLAISDVSAYLTLALRRSYNQARIWEWEHGVRDMSPEVKEALYTFFDRVATAQHQGRNWAEVILN